MFVLKLILEMRKRECWPMFHGRNSFRKPSRANQPHQLLLTVRGIVPSVQAIERVDRPSSASIGASARASSAARSSGASRTSAALEVAGKRLRRLRKLELHVYRESVRPPPLHGE